MKIFTILCSYALLVPGRNEMWTFELRRWSPVQCFLVAPSEPQPGEVNKQDVNFHKRRILELKVGSKNLLLWQWVPYVDGYRYRIVLDKLPSPSKDPPPNFDSSVVCEVLRVTTHRAKFLDGDSKVHGLSSRKLAYCKRRMLWSDDKKTSGWSVL